MNLGVLHGDERGVLAETPREMIETGDYVTPSFNFQLRMNKPVLSYWNVAASYHLFGISEWSERLPIAIGALVIIGTAFGLGRLLGGTFAGLLAALVLATSPRFALLARRIIIASTSRCGRASCSCCSPSRRRGRSDAGCTCV